MMKDNLKELLNAGFTYLKDFFKQKHHQQIQAHQNYQNQMILNHALQMQHQIQQELFVALQGNHYTNVQPITASKHIRKYNWSIRNNTFIFRYTLAMSSIPAQTLLDIMRDNMNTDINQCLQDLLAKNPLSDVEMLYPCIFYGLRVRDIHPIGNDICISVVTNYI